MILAAMAACLLIPSLVQSTPWQPHPYADSPYASNPYGAPPITYNQKKYEVPKYEPTEPSYEDAKYQPTEPSYVVPKYQPTEPSYGVPKYQPTEPSYEVPKYQPTEPSYEVPKYKPAGPSYEVPKYGPKPAPIYTTPAPTSRYSIPIEKPYEEHKPSESYGKIEPEFAAVLIGGCDKCQGIEASAVYSPNVKSSIVPASPLKTCTLPAGVFYNDSLIVCGSGCQAIGTPCYTNKIGCDTWEQVAPIREYRERFTMTVVESCNALVVVGGFKCTNDVEIFHDGKWCDGPKHDGLHGLVFHSAVSYGESQVMVIGGLLKGEPTNNVFTIDVSNGKVEEAASLNFKRYSHASSPASWGGNDYIIVAGGFEDYCVTNKVEFIQISNYGYSKPTWQMLAPMNVKRFDFGLAMYGSQLAAFGGQPPIESENIEVYDPETNCWKLASQVIAHPERQFFTAITVPKSYFQETPTTPSYTNPPVYLSPPKYTEAPVYPSPPTYTEAPVYPSPPKYTKAPVYPSPPKYTKAPVYTTAPSYMEPVPEDEDFATVLIGGCDNDIGIKDSEIYSPNFESDIIPASPMPTCTKPAGVFYNGSVVICGGVTDGQGTPCYSNKIGTKEWREFCPLLEHRDRFTMTAVESSNALVIVGGFKSGKDVEIYKDGKWQYGPELRDQGLVHHCSVQYNNKVMVTGGFCSGKPTDTVQTICVESNQVDTFAPLNSKRYAHSCMAMSWGGADYVVVAGGFQDYSVSNTVEFIPTKMDGYSAPAWKTLPSMNIRRFDFGLGIYGKKLAAFGGQPTLDSDKIEVYCPESKQWRLVGRSIVHPERHFFTAITVPESSLKVKVIGY